MSTRDELDQISDRYIRRRGTEALYSRMNPDVIAGVHEREKKLISLLSSQGISSLHGLDLLEVGCGSGSHLLEFLLLGAEPGRLVGNELLDERLSHATGRLPEAVQLFPGDASALPFPEASFDIVSQSTVFSSILDPGLQKQLATAMWRWVRPGGGVLWYDFTFNNPSNHDVRGVPIRRIRELFPDARISARRVTLAPPISRRVVRLHPVLYGVFNLLPLLRTHLLCWIGKR